MPEQQTTDNQKKEEKDDDKGCCCCLLPCCCCCKSKSLCAVLKRVPWISLIMVGVLVAGGYYITTAYDDNKDELKAMGYDTDKMELAGTYFFAALLCLDVLVLLFSCICFSSKADNLCLCCAFCDSAGWFMFFLFKTLELVMFAAAICATLVFATDVAMHVVIIAMKEGCKTAVTGCAAPVDVAMWTNTLKETEMDDGITLVSGYCTVVNRIDSSEEMMYGAALLALAQIAMAMTAAALSTQVLMKDAVAEASFRV